jgi:hypothetical protein
MPTPAEARAIAKEAYIYGFPLVDNYRIEHSYFVDTKSPEYKAPWNQLANIPRVFTPDDKAVQTPNSDTPYSWIGFDLRAEPFVLTLPTMEKERYFSVQFTDAYTYPLSKAANQPPMEFISSSKVPFNTVHANDFEFFNELDHVIQKEPVDFIDPELRGLAAAIGIVKGRKFAPDARMKKILTDAVAVGNATARAIEFRDRDPRNALYQNSNWINLFGAADWQWLEDGGTAGRNPRCANEVLLRLHREHARHGGEDRGQGLAIRNQLPRQRRQPIRRRKDLPTPCSRERPRQRSRKARQ